MQTRMKITGKVKADYYFGSPVNNGSVALEDI